MPRTHNLLASLALLVPAAFSVPFYVQETCYCQPSRPDLTTQSHNETLAACNAFAAKVEISRAAARRLPFAPEAFIEDHDMISLGERIHNLNDNASPNSTISERRKSTFDAAMKSIPNLAAEHARHQHAAQTLPPRRNPRVPSVREQELRRRGIPDPEEYKISCRGVVLTPSQSGHEGNSTTLYIGFRPMPVLFILLAMVLACTTIVEFALDTWQRYTSRIRLEGTERIMYADAATSAPSHEIPRERTGEIDVEKRAEARDS